ICIQNSTPIDKASVLRQYQCFIDDVGLLRMFTRLSKAPLFEFDQKFPVILPANCTVSYLIIRHEHARLLHAGVYRTMEAVRDRYFIFNLRRMTKWVRR